MGWRVKRFSLRSTALKHKLLFDDFLVTSYFSWPFTQSVRETAAAATRSALAGFLWELCDSMEDKAILAEVDGAEEQITFLVISQVYGFFTESVSPVAAAAIGSAFDGCS